MSYLCNEAKAKLIQYVCLAVRLSPRNSREFLIIMPMERILLTILYAFLAWLLYYAESAGDNWKDRLPSLFLFILLVGAIPEGVRLTRRLLHRLRRDWHSHRSIQH